MLKCLREKIHLSFNFMLKKKLFLFFCLLFILSFIISFKKDFLGKDNKHALLQNIYVQEVMHVYHSFRKIPDIFFVPISFFSDSSLDKYEIFIKDKDLVKLNSKLDKNPFDGLLKDGNKIWVDAVFKAGDYVDNIKIRYKGNLANHWNSYKKSYVVKFPKNHLFNGIRELSLIIPYDRKYFSTSLNNFRIRKMESLPLDEFYVRLSVNGSEEGIMLAMEHWSQEWIEKRKFSPSSTFFGVMEEGGANGSVYSLKNLYNWKSWNNKDADFSSLKTLILLLNDASVDEFKKIAPIILDLKSFYIADLVRVLSGGYHASDDGNNIVLLFDSAEGRFRAIPYNVGLSDVYEEKIDVSFAPKLQKRIWEIKEFKKDRDDLLFEYVKNNIKSDIAFLDDWFKKMIPEFYRDNAKLQNNFSFKKDLYKYKNVAIDYLKKPVTISEVNVATSTYRGLNGVEFPVEFSNLSDAVVSIEDFVKLHKQFYIKNNKIMLSAGKHFFKKNVIIPRNTKLIIKSGARIYMGDGVSFLSYSPVEILGTEQRKVYFSPIDKKSRWGSFSVINVDNDISIVLNTVFSGAGGGLSVNGVNFSGAVAFHNSDLFIVKSEIKNIYCEDALNVKNSFLFMKDNTIKDVKSDGLDVDFISSDSVIDNNLFENIGGDAIDISGSNLKISRNKVVKCIDKGISVGESSRVFVLKNIISKCGIGVASKDKSISILKDNSLFENDTALSIYKKKDVFGGAFLLSLNNHIYNNNINVFKDDLSQFVYIDNVLYLNNLNKPTSR